MSKNGLKKTFMMPDGTMYEYSYGNNNELREVRPSTPLRMTGLGAITIPDYTWNRPAKMVFPGGTQRTYGYDALMRLKTLTATDPGGNPLLDYAYTYDATGNIVTKATEHGMYGYDYDASSRLTSVDNPVLENESYTYDAVGNRLTAVDVSGTWNYNQNNELLGYADVEYEYDENGNMIQKRVGTAAVNYMYDAANRLVKVEDDVTKTVIAEYYYDPFGRRLWKEVGGIRTYFFYADEGLVAEYDANGNELRSYGYVPGSPYPVFLKQNETYYWYQNDHLGTPQKLIAVNGAVVWSARYRAFGKATVTLSTVTNPLRFPGQYEDIETGLYYNWYRYYDPAIGRYITPDPIRFGGGDFNLYEYVRSNPIQRYDILGLQGDLSLYPQSRNPLEEALRQIGNWLDPQLPSDGPILPPDYDLQDQLEQEILELQNRKAVTWAQVYEMADKHLRYWFAKTFLVHKANWQMVLDDWYKETNLSPNYVADVHPGQSYIADLHQEWDNRYPFPQDGKFPHLYYEGVNNSLNQDIKDNPGFRVLLRCWVHYRRIAQELGIKKPPDLEGNKLDPPMKFGNILLNGFDWDFIVTPWEGAGGLKAFMSSMAQLLGSYQVKIEHDAEKPDTYLISIIDSKGWASATRRPDKEVEWFNVPKSAYLNEPRGSHPGRFFERGGTIFLQFKFKVEESSCAECELPIELEKEIRRALKK